MKQLELNDIKKIINISKTNDQNCLINKVTDNIKRISNNTVVFHINKDVELNTTKFYKLTNCYIVTDQPLINSYKKQDRFLFVSNVDSAYRIFINYYRNLFNIPVIAVTGTCGKTSTKEMITQVLKQKYNVVHTINSKNSLSYNNDYLFSIDDKTNYGVFETAITHPGNLIYGCEFFKPSIGIITTIGIDHLNWCKTFNNYIRTKAEMLTGLQNKGILIINNDDSNIKKIDMSNYQGKIITFGIKEKSDFFGEKLTYSSNGMRFILIHNNKRYKVYVQGYGEHNVYNALAALAALSCVDMNLEDSIRDLIKYIPIKSHIEFQKGINNSVIIDDTWSSNPTSVKASLKVLSDMGQGKTKIAVIGKISYLGSYEEQYYQLISKMIIDDKIDILVTKDENAKTIGTYSIELGMNPNNVIHCPDNNELYNMLVKLLNENSMVLFKSSMLDKSTQEVIKKLELNN